MIRQALRVIKSLLPILRHSLGGGVVLRLKGCRFANERILPIRLA